MYKHFVSIIAALVLLTAPVFALGEEQSYVIDLNGDKQQIPAAYSVVATYSYFNLGVDTLSGAQDLCVDGKDNLYILDSGNERIIKLDSEGNIIREYRPKGEAALKSPSGIYADSGENMYIADTGNGRVLILDKNGKMKSELKQPDSKLYDTAYPFKPLKVDVDEMGQIYVINSLDYHGFTILDEDGRFKGYLAATRVGTEWWTKIVGLFATQTQKEQLGQTIPATHSNFTITPDGSIYATTVNTDAAQLARYSPVGNNFYPNQGSFGDTSVDYIMSKMGKTMSSPEFVDVCVDSGGIVNILDNLSGRIYQYDQDGVMICVFGGTGNWAGRFMNAVAMAQDSKGRIYVLDQNLGTVQVFKPTKFINTVHEALDLYYNGKYVRAKKLWQQILVMDSSYHVAHIGMGKAELKQGDYEASMADYKAAGDKPGYSDAFAGYFKKLVQKFFLEIVLAVCVLAAGIYLLVSRLYRKARKLSGGR